MAYLIFAKGGGLVLGFATRASAPPAKETVSLLSGVIATSPLLHQTFPASKILRFLGGKASAVLPNLLIDAPIPLEVCCRAYTRITPRSQHLRAHFLHCFTWSLLLPTTLSMT